MEIHWIYDGCDQEDEARVERCWDRGRIELEGKLAQLFDVPSELRMAVEQNDTPPEWEVHAALHLPGRTLVASSAAGTPEDALRQVLHGLAEEIDQDGDDPPVAATERREGIAEMLPMLRSWRSEGRSRAFMSFLVPVVETIGPYVQRELRIRENEGRLNGEEISASDVLDEVLILAWDQFNGTQNVTPLDLWLVRLAEQVMDRQGAQRADESLDDECPDPSREPRESQTDEWIEQASYPETIELSELLSDGPSVDTWDDLELETKQAHLAAMLGQLDREQRQAFVLNVAHGFDPATIADFQNRTVAQVEDDIARTTAEIRRYLMDEQTPDREEPFAQAEIREQRRRKR